MENNKEPDDNSEKPPPTSGITQILSEILDSSLVEPLPCTSRSASRPELSTPSNIQLENASKPCSHKDTIPTVHSTNSLAEEIVENPPLDPRTVKDILTEILDCTVVRIPSPSQPQKSERDVADPEFKSDPKSHSRQYNVRCSSDESACSRVQYTVKEALNEILDYSIFKRSIQPGSCRPPSGNDTTRPGPSHARPEYLSQGELGGNHREYQVYRAIGTGVIKSASFLQSPSAISMSKMLPSYSTVLRLGPPPPMWSFHSSSSFIPRQPPPSYAEVEGLWEDNPSMISSESVVLGPDPTYMVCPRCRAVVVTDIQMQRSNVTHLIALTMCICMCWPCCLLPYCLRSCNYTYHTCPNCRHYFGMYRPF